MNLQKLINSLGEDNFKLTLCFLKSPLGTKWNTKTLEEIGYYFEDFKKEVALYAAKSSLEERLTFYCELKIILEELETSIGINCLYDLKNSFLSTDEIHLAILKLIQEPISQSKLAQNRFHCSEQTLSYYINSLRDGWSLGDMYVQLDIGRNNKLESSVHPILLPLNLSEVYTLLLALGEFENSHGLQDPHGLVINDIANRIYGQLTQYAKDRVTQRLEERGIKYEDDKSTSFTTFRSESPNSDDWILKNNHWLYFVKSGIPVKVIDLKGNCYEGKINTYLTEEQKEIAERHAAFVLKSKDDIEVVLRWDEILDMETEPSRNETKPGNKKD